MIFIITSQSGSFVVFLSHMLLPPPKFTVLGPGLVSQFAFLVCYKDNDLVNFIIYGHYWRGRICQKKGQHGCE